MSSWAGCLLSLRTCKQLKVSTRCWARLLDVWGQRGLVHSSFSVVARGLFRRFGMWQRCVRVEDFELRFNFPPIIKQASMLQDAFGCAVANRYLLDDDADPFDLMSQVETVKEKKKKKKKEDEDKKKQKKPGHKESQKDRRLPLASDGQDLAPGELNTPPPPSLWFPILSFTHNQLQTILAAARISGFGWCSQERWVCSGFVSCWWCRVSEVGEHMCLLSGWGRGVRGGEEGREVCVGGIWSQMKLC